MILSSALAGEIPFRGIDSGAGSGGVSRPPPILKWRLVRAKAEKSKKSKLYLSVGRLSATLGSMRTCLPFSLYQFVEVPLPHRFASSAREGGVR